MKCRAAPLLVGILIGAALFGGGQALAAGIVAQPTWQPIYIDGQQVDLEAYNIAGNNYLKLRDIGKALGFNVYWQDGVRVDTTTSYTGEAPAAALPAGTESTAAVDVDAAKAEIISLTNALRAENGVAALKTDDLLMQAAQVRADEMAATGVYSHTRPDGSQYYTITDCPYMTENIHEVNGEWMDMTGKCLSETAVDDWANSQGHLDHILSNKVDRIGVGITESTNNEGKTAWYCVQLFLYAGQAITWVDEPIENGAMLQDSRQ